MRYSAVLTVLTGCLLIHGALSQAACPFTNVGRGSYTFGSECQFQCHCWDRNTRCDRATGACGSECEPGWAGPGCQYKNFAHKQSTDTNYARDVDRIVDDTIGRCNFQDNPAPDPFVRVTMQQEVYVSEVIITLKNYSAAQGISVYAGISTIRDASTLCYTDTGDDVISGNTVHAICPRRMLARTVTVILRGMDKILEVCDVAVTTGRLISWLKPTATNSNSERPSDEAVNGYTGDYYGSLETDNPWWRVDLGSRHTITYIQLHNRMDLREQFVGAQILLSDTDEFSDAEVIYTNLDTPASLQDILRLNFDGQQGRYLWVYARGFRKRLNIREISVYGGCGDNRCGVMCTDLCYCADKQRSLQTDYTGVCRAGCERNWRDIDGFCNVSACGPSSFGYECRYACNCAGRCDPWTGLCIYETDICKRHYYGPNCQAANLIQDTSGTIQGSGNVYNEAPITVDGRPTTCSIAVSGDSPSWLASLGLQRNVTNVIVYVNDTNTGTGFEVLVETNDDVTSCETVRTAEGYYLGRCRNTPATHLRLRTRSSMQICEVAVLDCEDGTFGPLCEKTCQCAGRVPCNKITGLCPVGGCNSGYVGPTCENECQPGSYGPNCTLECGKCNGGEACDIFTGDCALPCQSGWLGGRCDSECFNGSYGVGCVETCGFCLNDEPCDKETGVCHNGCSAGYHGEKCLDKCEEGTYGFNCNMTCGNCSNDAVCDAIDGSCAGGCVLGQQPPLCQNVCNHGRYGMNCELRCGKCRNNATCNIYNGICDVGCEAGVYVTRDKPMCDIDCRNGRYGHNCTETCRQDICAITSVCEKATGACLRGCLYPGFQPPLCTSECWPGTYGLGCAYKCGSCAARQPCNATTGICHTGCEEGFVGTHCHDLDTSLSGVSIFLIVLVCLLIVACLLAVATVYWVYKKGTLPWTAVQMRREEKRMAAQRDQRNFSIVSRVYENNVDYESETKKTKRSNSNDVGVVLSESKPRGTIAVPDFWDYVQDRKTSRNEMIQQFKDLALGLTHPCEVAKKAQNLRKNRYKEIFAYDHSRVKLDVIPGDSGNDYYNACYISGYNRPHMYIAAQGPTEELVNDFWRMVWQKKCRKIAMLTRLVEHNKVKCCQYWPDEGIKQYGGVKVEVKDTDTFADFAIRTFLISAEGKEGVLVKHFHFESWPDRHVPEYASAVVHFWSTIRLMDIKDNVPTLVHCSAGIGRSGTFLALDYLVDQAQAEGYVNVFQCVQNLRHQRVNMVQNQDQYVFLHEALMEALFCPSTTIPCDRFNAAYKKTMDLDPNTKRPKLELEFEKLQHVTKFHDSMVSSFYDNGDYKAARSSVNAEKNRNKHILPSDVHRPYLTSRVQDRNDYINAVFLPSYRQDKSFLITQSPLPDTIIDFWRMVYENRVCTIVNLDRITTQSEIYWPVEGETVTFIPFQLHYVTEVDHVTHIERTIKLTNAEEPREKSMLIKQYECKFWMTDSRVPSGGESSLVSVYEHAQKWQASNGNPPLVVHCHNGATKSGLFCVVTSTLERLKQDRDVTLQHIIKQMRINRHQIVPTFEQYKFAHDVVADFLRGFDTFSNFYI